LKCFNKTGRKIHRRFNGFWYSEIVKQKQWRKITMAQGSGNSGQGNGSGPSRPATTNGTDLDDVLNGGNGKDTIFGLLGNDTISGGNAKDVLDGGDGDDALDGGNGNDMLMGGLGNDMLDGGLGNDNMSGGDGDDRFNGGMGHDVLSGGLGADVFVLDSNVFKGGSDVIKDFTLTVTTTTTTTDPDTGETTTTTTTVLGDVLDLHGILQGFDPVTDALSDFVHITESGGNTVVSVDRNGDGEGEFKVIATLEDITGLDAATLLANGQITVT
jgi:Ca2+-binding RTX toxin-like protein